MVATARPRASAQGKRAPKTEEKSAKVPAAVDQREIRRIVRQVEEVEEDDDENDDDESGEEEESDGSEDGVDEGFEVQSSSDEGSESGSASPDSDPEEAALRATEEKQRNWRDRLVGKARELALNQAKKTGELQLQQFMHVDDLSSDDEAAENTIGRVPLHWYDAFDHIGYDIEGQKIAKRMGKDRIDLALEQRDDPLSNRRVYDMYNDTEVVLSERDLEIIRRIQAGAFAHAEFNDTPDYVDYFTSEKESMPLSAVPTPKASFLPSKWEVLKIKQIMQGMKDGTYVPYRERQQQKKAERNEGPYMMWAEGEDEVTAQSRRMQFHLPAPKMPLPGHAESYNPPAEYLMTEEERAQWEELDPEDRPLNFVPQKFSALRTVPAYKDFVKERYERCMDLYLCPRKLKKRLNIDPESLIPRLPNPRDLKPFPNSLAMQFLGHDAAVRCLAVSPDGQFLASGDAKGGVRMWEISSGYCRASWAVGSGPVTSLAWNPQAQHLVLAAACGAKVTLITTASGNEDCVALTEGLLQAVLDACSGEGATFQDDDAEDDDAPADTASNAPASKRHVSVRWQARADHRVLQGKGAALGPRADLTLSHPVTHVAWHHKGDYLVVVTPAAASASVSVHQLSKARTQFPFKKSPGKVQLACFHPSLPCLVVATQQHIKVFHLTEQRLVKKLQSNCKWLSSLDVHASGDHILAGSYDRRVVWFDLDLSSMPYKTLKFHEKAVRAVSYHRAYPLFASCSDDGSVHVFHAQVYGDLLRNPLLVPLKVLRDHGVAGDLGVTALAFHPKQPWLFSAGADGVVNLYQDL